MLKRYLIIAIAVLICLYCIVLFLVPASTFAQSPTTATPTGPGLPWMREYSGGMISGMVLDEDGKPVSSAIVTLWQDGQPWELNTKLAYNGGNVNPRLSGIYGDYEGSFLFGLVAPGSYFVTAEKDGYSGSVNVTVDNVTIHSPSKEELDLVTQTVIITLPGYRVPVTVAGAVVV